jgi:hypothetical protein
LWLANSVPLVMLKSLPQAPAAEAGSAFQAAAIVGINAAAMAANRLAFRFVPADAPKRHLGLLILHRENVRQGKVFGGARKEEMLGHLLTYRL